MTDSFCLYSAVAAVNQDPFFFLDWRLAGLWKKKTNERAKISVGRNVLLLAW
jgi:hypothetical protein